MAAWVGKWQAAAGRLARGWGLRLRSTWLLAIGTALATGAVSAALEQMFSSQPDQKLLTASLVLSAIGVLVLLGGFGLSAWRRRQLGLYLAIFARAERYDERRIRNAIEAFHSWANRLQQDAYVLSDIQESVVDVPALKALHEAIKRTIQTANDLIPGESPAITLWLGGRLDVMFRLGQLLHDGLGLTGPIWIMSAAAGDTEEKYAPAGRLDRHPDAEESHPAQPNGPRMRQDQEPKRPGAPIAKLVDRQASKPITGLWCRAGGSWQSCDHQSGHHRGDLILGVDTSSLANDVQNRLATGIAKSACFADDVLLVLVTAPAIDGSTAAHSALVQHIVGSLIEGKARCASEVRQVVLLACPTTVAALLGSALALQWGTWHTADFSRDSQQYELTFEPSGPAASAAPVLTPTAPTTAVS